MRFSMMAVAVAATTFGLFISPANAADHACANSVQAELAKAGIITSEVTKIVYDYDDNDGQTRGTHTAWVYLKDQPGVLTINMTTKCEVYKVLARYGMKPPVVKTM